MDYSDEMERLYSRFVAEMDYPLSERYYSEDELIDIFDYSSDIEDTGVRMEVLLLAQRLCPVSRELAERKAMLYADLGSADVASKVLSKIRKPSFLGRLTALKISKIDQDIISGDLDFLIKDVHKESLNDEDIIQLIRLADNAQRTDWLVKNYEKIKTLAEFPETFMYDLVEPLLDAGDVDMAFVNKVLDDLTLASPYDVGYWEFAADIALNKENDPERALGFLEYALAIDPKSLKSLDLKSSCLIRIGGDSLIEAVEVARKGYELYPESKGLAVNYAQALRMTSHEAEALDVLHKYIESEGANLVAIGMMTDIDPDFDLVGALETATKDMPKLEQRFQLDKLLSAYVSTGNHKFAAQVMAIIDAKGFGDGYSSDFKVPLYFRANMFDNALDALKGADLDNTATWLLVVLMSLPSQMASELIKLLDERLELLDMRIADGTYSEVLESRALKAYILKIKGSLTRGTCQDVESMCPFTADLRVK